MVTNNTIDNLTGGNFGSVSAVTVGYEPNNFDVTALTISGNTITNISAVNTPWASGGKRAYDLLLNLGATGWEKLYHLQLVVIQSLPWMAFGRTVSALKAIRREQLFR
ncbi:MAG: hypothetical protein IPI15_17155 [Saprospiraceae bacterium]|uniref:hypothetical protein n=1 Tax=Candidatus Brachybacter algidus TaxID=2982024 RepID=UPI0025802F0F|nr:hypothetical protein [Candidatus Brachybacter algidus]MBK7605264.1 hypothetical protein [Candidatus Brachybacter algidus]